MYLSIKINEKYFPWDKGQVVVELSRNKSHKKIILVGSETFSKEKAIERMYLTLCQATHWTGLMEMIVENVSIKPNSSESSTVKLINYAEMYPYRVCDVDIPHSNSGFVYMLSSTHVNKKFYVGQTENLVVRINDHNMGRGAKPTKIKAYQPWSPVSFMCNMSHLSKPQRELLERDWQQLNYESVASNGSASMQAFIDNGQTVADKYNTREVEQNRPQNQINYIKLVELIVPTEAGTENSSTNDDTGISRSETTP